MIDNHSFNIIRHYGQQNVATYRGRQVVRYKELWVDDYGLVPCAPYDEHFIFKNPYEKEKGSVYICTCGSPGVVVSATGYLLDASPQGKMLVCLLHAKNGYHSNLETKWI